MPCDRIWRLRDQASDLARLDRPLGLRPQGALPARIVQQPPRRQRFICLQCVVTT
jgi:hypothetical protein